MRRACAAVYSDADKDAPHLAEAGQSIALAGVRAEETYLNREALLAALRESGADAVHPGYGFLAESAVSPLGARAPTVAMVLFGASTPSANKIPQVNSLKFCSIEAGKTGNFPCRPCYIARPNFIGMAESGGASCLPTTHQLRNEA